MNIYLEQYVITTMDFTDYDIAVYVALRAKYDSRDDEFYISTRMLAYELYGHGNIPTRALKHIKESIYHLAEYGIYEIVDELTIGNEFIIQPLALYFEHYNPETRDGSYFTIVSLDEVRCIMNSDTKRDKFALLRFFIIVIGSFNRKRCIHDGDIELKNFVGNISVAYLGERAGLDKSVADNYFTMLEDIELLYVYRHNKAILDANKNLRTMTNHYGRYCHKEHIKAIAIEDEKGVTCIDISDSNRKRSLKCKYNMIVKDPSKYIIKYQDDLLDIYIYITEQNVISEKEKYDESLFDGIDCIEEYRSKNDLDKINFNIDEIFDDLFDTQNCGSEID